MLSKKKKNKKDIILSSSGYEIKKSSHGPVVLYGNEILFLDQGRQLFDVVDENPGFLFELNQAITEHIKVHIDNLMESLSERRMFDPISTMQAMNVVHSYFRFVYQEYPEYRKALALTLLDSPEVEASAAINSKEVNEFYKIYESANQDKIKEFIKKLEEIQ